MKRDGLYRVTAVLLAAVPVWGAFRVAASLLGLVSGSVLFWVAELSAVLVGAASSSRVLRARPRSALVTLLLLGGGAIAGSMLGFGVAGVPSLLGLQSGPFFRFTLPESDGLSLFGEAAIIIGTAIGLLYSIVLSNVVQQARALGE